MTFSLRATSFWLVLLALFLPGPVQANGPAQLILRNLPLQDDRLLVVTIQLENVTDLYGAEIQLRYNPAQLKVRDEDPRLEGVQIAPGPLLAFDDRFVALNQADAQAGLIDFVFTLLKPAPPINHTGVLATVAFEVTGSGPFKIEVAQAKFVSSKLAALPVATTALELAGPQALNTVTPSAAVRSPFWWGWTIAGVMGLVLAALLLLRWLPAGTAGPGGSPAARRVPGGNASTTRTAALLAEQGRRAMTQGDLAQAYERFSQAIELDPANAAAWLGKGLVAQQDTEKRICFQRALALEPGNSQARTELQRLGSSLKGFMNHENYLL